MHGNGIFMENILDLLYVSLIDLCERRNLEELSNGTLHTNLWNRITEEKPTQNHRWMYEKENMNTFWRLVIHEAEFETVSVERILDLRDQSNKQHRKGIHFFISSKIME